METFAGFGSPSGFGSKPALVVVDFSLGFTDANSPLGFDCSREVEATRQLLEMARELSLPIVFTTVVYEPHGKDGAHFTTKIPALRVLTATSEWVRIDPRLGREESELLIEKKFASAFFGTPLCSYLASQQVDTVIVTGCTTSGCVRATAVDAMQYGYRVVVPVECVGDRNASAHQANLYDINSKYGDVISLAACRQYLQNVRPN